MSSTNLKTIWAPIFKDWSLFSLSYIAVVTENIYGLSVVAKNLTPIAYSEWAVIAALMVVFGAISQWGFKTGYMQMIVEEVSRVRQHQSLRAGLVFLTSFGFFAGFLISGLLGSLSLINQWSSVGVLSVIPFLLALNNAQILLVSDLRITGRVHLLTILTFIRAPIFVVFIYTLTQYEVDGLLSIYLSQVATSLFMVFGLCVTVKLDFKKTFRWQFIQYAFRMGTPVMLGLLLKYASDALVTIGLRWGVGLEDAADYGRAMKMAEPFNALYFSAFLMAWGPNIFLIIRDSGSDMSVVRRAALGGLKIVILGMGLAYVASWGMMLIIPPLSETSLTSLVLWMVLSRMASFAALSPAQYGFVISRRYHLATKLYFFELLATAILFLGALSLKQIQIALWFASAVPWLVVISSWYLSKREAKLT